jgi:head-tail adaptor
MDASKLTWPLVLEARSLAPDGAGGRREIWVPLGSIWGDLQPKSGRELEGEAASISRSLWSITVRASPVGASSRPIAGHRFRHGSRFFGILAVQETDETARWLRCAAEEERAT